LIARRIFGAILHLQLEYPFLKTKRLRASRDRSIMTDDFIPRLGRIGWKGGTRLDRYVNRVMHAAHKAGHLTKSGSSFSGSRSARGAAFGTLAGAGFVASGRRRVVVKARIAKLKPGDLGAARAHLRYIQRDGVTPEGKPGRLYDTFSDDADGTGFLEQADGDRHQFRFIVSAEDATEMADLKPFIRDLMQKMEEDLETRLDWVAVDHFNTGHPHTHIVVRGKDDRGEDLVIARDYISHGIRERARELVTLELGPEIEGDFARKLDLEVEVDRFTRLDRSLLREVYEGFLVVSALPPSDPETHAAYMGRLRKLERLGLATERRTGVWEVPEEAEAKLKQLGGRDDVIKTMHRVLREANIDRPAGGFAIFDAANLHSRIVGRVAGLGLSDELRDKHYLVVDGIDGRVHYADAGYISPELVPEKGMIVSVEGMDSASDQERRARVRILSYLPLEKLIDAKGATWLDKQIVSARQEATKPEHFGAEVDSALTRRRQWLISQGLGVSTKDGKFQPVPNLLGNLRGQEIRRAGLLFSKKLGLAFCEVLDGEQVSGVYRQPVELASGKFAIIEKAKEFSLVPWQASMEKVKAKRVSVDGARGPDLQPTTGLSR
jgi:type IV secretory pathway VirD2 relaxase